MRGPTFETKLTVVAVGTAITRLVQNNPARVAISFQVAAASPAYISNSNKVSATTGFPLYDTQAPFSLSDVFAPQAAGDEWYGIGSAAGTLIAVLETIDISC